MTVADQSVSIPYLYGEENVNSVVDSIKSKCTAQEYDVKRVDDAIVESESNPVIVQLKLSSFKKDGTPLATLAESNAAVFDLIQKISKKTDDYLVIYTSDATEKLKAGFEKRAASAPGSSAVPLPFKNRPILDKYILFNNGVFEATVALIIFIIIAVVGINVLGAIQTPTKFDAKQA
ncbi:hypothetical protein HDV05_005800 [Chytridiales sp. JEL 0842]|nr:hypothetical protein HDV05_005800 [Chytridiales sp. JEL 0842]